MKRKNGSQRHSDIEATAKRFAALNRVGTALASELDEGRLLHLIAATARELTGAEFAAFSLRPVDSQGQLLVPSEGNLFHLAAVVGVTETQEELFRRMPLGGEGLLAPIFRHGVVVRVSDALAHIHSSGYTQKTTLRDEAQEAAFAFAHGQLASDELRSMGVPHGHPVVRSFLGGPLLDHSGQVRGGLLLGHGEPDCFTAEDEALLIGLAAQAAVFVENARLYRVAQTHIRELDTIFDSITDGIVLVDSQGNIVRENNTARRLREILGSRQHDGVATSSGYRGLPIPPLTEDGEQETLVTVTDSDNEARQYLIKTFQVYQPVTEARSSGDGNEFADSIAGAVVVWHDVTEARRLLIERQAHAETEARRVLLQSVIDELPSCVYLVRGKDARLVLANRATSSVWGASWSEGQTMADFLATNGIQVFGSDGHLLTIDELVSLRALHTGESVRHFQEVICHPNGISLPVLLNAVAIDPLILGWTAKLRFAAGTGIEDPAVVVIMHDVTALKEAEQLKDEFIGIAAHELRNPLAVLKGFAHMLITQTARGKGPPLADWQTEAIEAIDQATTRLVGLTEDLLDMTRLQAGLLELQPSPTELGMLVKRAVARLRITSSQHTLLVQAPSEHIIVDIDPQRIEQVLTNLLNNAMKYSPEGGEIEITIYLKTETNVAQLSVRDQGMGIPLAQQSHIFGRFVRADNVRAQGIQRNRTGTVPVS